MWIEGWMQLSRIISEKDLIKFSNGVNLYNQRIMKRKKNKKTAKAVNRAKVLKPVKTRKFLVHPVKSRKAGISAKPKLFNRAGKISAKKANNRKIKTKKKILKKKPAVAGKNRKKKKAVKKVIKKKVKAPILRKKNSRKIIKKAVAKKKTKTNPKKTPKKSVHKSVKLVIKKKKTVLRKVENRTSKARENEFSPESLFKAKIKVIGIGGGGGSIVSEFGRSLQKASFVVADTDVRALKKKPGIKYFWFGEEFTRGLGTGVDVDLAKRAAESVKEKIGAIFKEQDIVIFVASLGGGLGSGATQVFAEAAKNFGGITMGIFTMPFKFEGKNKYRIAQAALKTLKGLLNVSLVIPNERIFKIIDESTPILSAFSTVNKMLIESLESLIELIYNPGIINIDFADLRSILRGRGSSAFLNTVEGLGNNRAEKICESVFNNPLLQNGGLEAEKILFNIEGSDKLSMFEVEKISSHISATNPNAKIIFGISKNQKLKNKIRTTILMTGGQVKELPQPQKQEKPKEVTVKQPERKVEKKAIVEKLAEVKKETVKMVKRKKVKKEKRRENPPVIEKNKNITEENPADARREEPIAIPVPVFNVPATTMPIVEQKRISILETQQVSTKKAIRRSGLEIKRAEELAERRKAEQEKEWEIPAFLRKVRFKN